MFRRNQDRRKRTIAIALAALVSPVLARSQDLFSFHTNKLHPYTPAYLGNGAISLVTTPLAVDPARSFLAGVYDHTPGDVPRIASAPAWNEIGISNGSHWLNAGSSSSSIEQYDQQLDMYNGVLRTHYRWTDSNKSIRIDVQQFVSRDNPHLAAVSLAMTPEFSGKISVSLALRNWPPPHRYDLERMRTFPPEAQKDSWAIWYPGWLHVEVPVATLDSTATLSLLATAPGTGIKLGEAVALESSVKARPVMSNNPESAQLTFTFDAGANQTYIFRKFAALVTSQRSNKVRDSAVGQAQAARKTGWDHLLAASTEAWHKLWQSDINVEGNANLQRIIHSMLFYLYGSTREDLDISLGPMGLSSAGYYGHIFWDADTFMFPALLMLHPELARPMVAFRSRTRPIAVDNAKKNGFRGAMYPWEAGPDGAESTPRFAFQNATSENHVNGDVALTSWQYWLATGDHNWLQNDAWPILRDTADFWVSRVTLDPKRGQYVIGNVVAVNESEIGVSNDPYTNAIAKKNLELALAAARVLHTQSNPRWKEVAEKMFLPDSDSSLLWFPLDRPYPPDKTREAIQKILSRIEEERSGAMMGTEFYPILAAQIHDRAAIGQLLLPLCLPYLRPPFNVVAETPHNQNTNFITGSGAFLQQFVFGYTGLRLTENGLEHPYQPTVPPGITRLTLKSISIRGQRQTLTFDANGK
jgi:trehalose/maltose hydrolase-like predicted phosphorylase